jgi:hypothetical protein
MSHHHWHEGLPVRDTHQPNRDTELAWSPLRSQSLISTLAPAWPRTTEAAGVKTPAGEGGVAGLHAGAADTDTIWVA